nr:ACP S-malonyltransferase [Kibdelosporangium sp. MJ126-NF4]CEL17815.1 Malonyl CoA-acyl carrier protein transacylase [Kibdelosporangium sp. MJ126-NF4]CTQ90961.1 Malonyl CoA-acyl carrier protein transacylase (EC 2.3.1.39) [Kibdelosporangium sp. MJ126-NF4]
MIAAVFPGQGSQLAGMGRELLGCGPDALKLVPLAEEVTGLPVEEWLTRADAATLADPQVAHLTVFVYSSVLWHELRQRGARPVVLAGHSLGEYSALAAARCLEWHTALEIVAYRGRVMAESARQRSGTMGAIVGLSTQAVEQLCAAHSTGSGVVVVANLNSPRQSVISGTENEVLAVLDAARQRGAMRARRIPVGGAYHSPLMARAQESLDGMIAGVRLDAPRVRLVSSVTGRDVTDVEAYRGELRYQMTRPVRWRDVVAALHESEVDTVWEVGPGRVLTGLGREMARERDLGTRHLTGRELAATAPALVGRRG